MSDKGVEKMTPNVTLGKGVSKNFKHVQTCSKLVQTCFFPVGVAVHQPSKPLSSLAPVVS